VIETSVITLSVRTSSHCEFVNIDALIQAEIDRAGIEHGSCVVYVPHTTAGVTINENADPDVVADMELILDRMAPWKGGYAHAEGNSAAHVKASMMGSSAHVLIADGRLQFGTWQSLYFCEFDGPRHRSVWVQITPR
jgi:secondary thiamine-phosphate synthase enzyme